jgi:hypothetical protein
MLAGFVLAVMALVIVVVLVIQERLTSHLRRSQEAYPPPGSTPRPLILSVLAWATVAQAGLWGVTFAVVLWWGISPAGEPRTFSDHLSLVWYALLCAGPAIGAYRGTRDLVALRPDGPQRAARAVASPVVVALLVGITIAVRLVRPLRAWMGETSGWTSPEAIQSYALIGLLLTLTILLTILSTVITHALRSEEVRRLFPETQAAPQPTPSL